MYMYVYVCIFMFSTLGSKGQFKEDLLQLNSLNEEPYTLLFLRADGLWLIVNRISALIENPWPF